MLGYYESFPEKIHKIARFATSASNKKLQQRILKVLYKLNNEHFNLEEVAKPSVFQCTVIFEFGIAEANNFNYLDAEETSKVLKIVHKKPLQMMDFFCAIRYYMVQNKNKVPLKFDYYMLRFKFDKNSTELQIFHERGPRHLSPEDIVMLLTNKINETFSKKILKAI
jgi:hypothetical protein